VTVAIDELHSQALSIPRARMSQGLLVEAGPLLFVSGLTAHDGQGAPVGTGDAAVQARVVLRAIGELCEQAGGSLRDVVKLTVYLRNVADGPAVGAARAEFFPRPPYPASSMVEVSRLMGPDQLVEIDAVAAIGQSAKEG
jgi:2-iminobutanoate/2-iminopropanoate deaminase